MQQNEQLFTACGDEVLLQVFSFLSPLQLLSAVSLVCVRWHTIAKDRLLWRVYLKNCFSHVCNLDFYLASFPCKVAFLFLSVYNSSSWLYRRANRLIGR